MYGWHADPPLTPAILEKCRALLQHVYDEGPHPNAFIPSPKHYTIYWSTGLQVYSYSLYYTPLPHTRLNNQQGMDPNNNICFFLKKARARSAPLLP